jgi:hypothetical protein
MAIALAALLALQAMENLNHRHGHPQASMRERGGAADSLRFSPDRTAGSTRQRKRKHVEPSEPTLRTSNSLTNTPRTPESGAGHEGPAIEGWFTIEVGPLRPRAYDSEATGKSAWIPLAGPESDFVLTSCPSTTLTTAWHPLSDHPDAR